MQGQLGAPGSFCQQGQPPPAPPRIPAPGQAGPSCGGPEDPPERAGVGVGGHSLGEEGAAVHPGRCFASSSLPSGKAGEGKKVPEAAWQGGGRRQGAPLPSDVCCLWLPQAAAPPPSPLGACRAHLAPFRPWRAEGREGSGVTWLCWICTRAADRAEGPGLRPGSGTASRPAAVSVSRLGEDLTPLGTESRKRETGGARRGGSWRPTAQMTKAAGWFQGD